MTTYTVLIGINYPPDDTRSEPGDVLADDFATKTAIKRLIKRGAIAEVEDPAPEAPSPAEATTAAEPTVTPPDGETDASAAPSPATDGNKP